MRYDLGYMDKYPIEAAGSTVENNPMYRVLFKDPIDKAKLESAVLKGLESIPLFATKVCFDGEYYLETNENPLVILECTEEERPKTFGADTNLYPWRMCVDGRLLIFEWLHGVSDGMGALTFLKYVICRYFGIDTEIMPAEQQLAPGMEPFEDKKQKGDNFSIDPAGYKIKDFPKKYNGCYKTDCHLVRTSTDEILKCAKANGTSVTPLIAVLWSKAVRLHLPAEAKNRKVSCNIVMDLRRPLKYQTLHNCVEYKRITYLDEYDGMNFDAVTRIYKEKLDNARKEANVVKAINDRMSLFRCYHLFRRKGYLKWAVGMIGKCLKDSDCNFVVTYPGKIELPAEIGDRIEDFEFKVWHDFGECIIAAVDYNGNFNMNISENYATKGVVEDFIRLSAEAGIHFTEESCSVYEQAHFEE